MLLTCSCDIILTSTGRCRVVYRSMMSSTVMFVMDVEDYCISHIVRADTVNFWLLLFLKATSVSIYVRYVLRWRWYSYKKSRSTGPESALHTIRQERTDSKTDLVNIDKTITSSSFSNAGPGINPSTTIDETINNHINYRTDSQRDGAPADKLDVSIAWISREEIARVIVKENGS